MRPRERGGGSGSGTARSTGARQEPFGGNDKDKDIRKGEGGEDMGKGYPALISE